MWLLTIANSNLLPVDCEPSAHVPLYPTTCDMAARGLPPRLLQPPPATADSSGNPQDNVKMELENASLWKQFSSVGTEMIVTKKGRLEHVFGVSKYFHHLFKTSYS